jgi:hypothetical protein
MNPTLARIAFAALLIAAFPSVGLAQQVLDDTAPVAATPAPGLPPATTAAQSLDTVQHIRQLVRDVQSNTDNIKSKGDFGAQLWLVQGQEFFQDWVKPATPSINPISIAPRGENIYTVIIFYGLAHDHADLSNVSYDITVLRPDGAVYSDSKNLIGWQGLAPQESRSLELGRDHIAINIDANDPPGLYTVNVVVRDNISHVDLPLKQTFVVR